MKIAFIGYGQVGSALADQLQRRGHTVTLAAHRPDSDSVKAALARNGQLGGRTGPGSCRGRGGVCRDAICRGS